MLGNLVGLIGHNVLFSTAAPKELKSPSVEFTMILSGGSEIPEALYLQ